MKNSLRILHLENDPADAELVRSTLATAGVACAITRVQDRAAFTAALERGEVDLVIAAFSLPEFDGMSALEIVRAKWPEVPYILVSGRLGEEVAVESLKSGAMDYVLKEQISRLVPAVQRAMQEVAGRLKRRQGDELAIQSQKMEVFGQLAAGVAHDFNNLLAVIIGYGDMVMAATDPDLMHKYTEEIRHAADRAAALTRQLLVFSRKQTVQPVVLDLNSVVADMNKMLRRLIDDNVELIILPGPDIGHVRADAGHVGQVLMNLVVNARDAMANGGKLTIGTSNITLDENYTATHEGATPGPHVLLSVSDTGTGMTDEVKRHLFEAFFTTKPTGKGTGLGLPTCQTILKQCGGHIGFYSEFGTGTTFKVYFPRVGQPLDTATEFFKRGPLPRGTETLLLVEDDPSLRHLASSILLAQGYNVLRANNGKEGLRVAGECQDQLIRLVITDVIMPQMGGKEMADRLHASWPDLEILFTSGYSDDAITHHGVLDSGIAFLSKPYTPAALARKVREMLDAKPDEPVAPAPALP